MDYEFLLNGSPLIPLRFFGYYFTGVFAVLITFLLARRHSKSISIFRAFTHYHLILSFILTATAVYLLLPTPHVSNIRHTQSSTGKDKIAVHFNRPVKRGELTKTLNPYVPGIWIFEDPVYGTHLYRQLVFYPYSRLSPGMKYRINLSGVKNFMSRKSASFAMDVMTNDTFDVLGEISTGSKFMVIGSFPENGWDGLNIDTEIRIRFSHPVEKTQAEKLFSLNPHVDGTFSWEGETMTFKPDADLNYQTLYTLTEKKGVKILNGSLLTREFKSEFTTQAETTKLPVPSFLQKFSLSCEISALRMALAFRGIEASEDELLKLVGFDPNGKKGETWGNPYVGFVGSVRGKQMVNGYGVYWEPVARAANNYRYSKSFENWTVKQLTESIQKGTPVIIWISINGRTPSVWTTPTGDNIKVVPDEHAVVAVGYTGSPENPDQIIVNDPLIGEAYWPRESFNRKWDSLGNSGVQVF